MESQKTAGILGALVAAVALAACFYYAPKGIQLGAQQTAKAPIESTEPPKTPVVQDVTPGAPAVRGPVVKDITP